MLISATAIISNHHNSQRQNDEQKRTAMRKSKKDTTTPRSTLRFSTKLHLQVVIWIHLRCLIKRIKKEKKNAVVSIRNVKCGTGKMLSVCTPKHQKRKVLNKKNV
jgi:hypothetical protein